MQEINNTGKEQENDPQIIARLQAENLQLKNNLEKAKVEIQYLRNRHTTFLSLSVITIAYILYNKLIVRPAQWALEDELDACRADLRASNGQCEIATGPNNNEEFAIKSPFQMPTKLIAPDNMANLFNSASSFWEASTAKKEEAAIIFQKENREPAPTNSPKGA